jgi:hypothetical protein
MSYKVAIVSSSQSQNEKDLGRMISHLRDSLSKVKKCEVREITLEQGTAIDWQEFEHIVFCGYDHLTLSYLHQCLSTDPSSSLTFYDEPGKSLQSELNNIFFRGVDCSRIPASSLSAIEYSWSYRDILSLVERSCRNLDEKSLRSKPRSSSRNSQPRQVEDPGKAQTPEGDASDENGDNPGV